MPMTPRPVREILVATDFSGSAVAAADVAVGYARRFGARLHLLHVWQTPISSGPRTALEQLASALGPDVPIVTAVETGSPAVSILHYARDHEIDLIVVGTHGRTGFSRALIGSVAESVVRSAPCPVLAVRGGVPAGAIEEKPEPPAPRRCVSCALPSEDLICAACRARIRGEALLKKETEERAAR